VLITYQHYHVTQRLVGTYSDGRTTKTVRPRPRPRPRPVWDRSCYKTAVSDPKTDLRWAKCINIYRTDFKTVKRI